MADTLDPDELSKLLAGAVYEQPEGDARYRIELKASGPLLLLEIRGMVLRATPEDFVIRLEEVAGKLSPKGIVVDLRNCQYLSSSALSLLVRFFDRGTQCGNEIVLLGAQAKVLAVINLLGLDRLFLSVENEAMAMDYFRSQGVLGDQASHL